MTSRLEVQEPDQHATYVATPIPGVFVFYPTVHADQRGSFHEWYKADDFAEALGYPFFPEQANMSVSARGVVRGIHLAEVPPGQAKMVTCPAGGLSDIIVDLRKGSSTYGKHIVVPLNQDNHAVVYLPVGIGHGFVAHQDNTVATYLTSTAYDPAREFGVRITDPVLGIDCQSLLNSDEGPALNSDKSSAPSPDSPSDQHSVVADPIFSEKDRIAPLLADIDDRLPTWEDCKNFEDELRNGWVLANSEAGVDTK